MKDPCVFDLWIKSNYFFSQSFEYFKVELLIYCLPRPEGGGHKLHMHHHFDMKKANDHHFDLMLVHS